MAGNLFQFPKPIGWDAGVVQAGSKLTFTATGTTTPQNTFTDLALTVAHSNPVVADSEGIFAPVYLDATLPDYRVKYTTSADVLIYQVDDVPASQTGPSQTLTGTAPFIDLIETDAAANNGVWRIKVNSEQLTIQLGNDALSSFVDVATIDRTANVCDAIAITTTALTTSGTLAVSGNATANSNSIAEITTGSFTANWTGFTTAQNTVINYTKVGTQVTMHFNTVLSATSNTTAMASGATEVPAALRPTEAQVICPTAVRDNGTMDWGVALVTSAGQLQLYKDVNLSNFTASGSKGHGLEFCFTYLID